MTVVAKLNEALVNALDQEGTRKRLLDLGSVIPERAARSPGALQKLVESEVARWARVLKTTSHSLAQEGQIEEARVEMRRLRKLQPDLSITWIKQSVPYTPVPMERFLDGMLKARLSE